MADISARFPGLFEGEQVRSITALPPYIGQQDSLFHTRPMLHVCW